MKFETGGPPCVWRRQGIFRCPAIFVLLLLLLAATRRDLRAEGPGLAGPTGRFYLGSVISASGTTAALFLLDQAAQRGWFYDPPRVIEFSVRPSGRDVVFLPAEISDQGLFSFQGTMEGSLIKGTVQLSKPSGIDLIRGQLVARLVPAEPEHTSELLGRFSNVEYVAESGDLIGAEIIILASGPRACGIAMFYGVLPDEFTASPLLLQDVKASGDDVVTFALQFPGLLLHRNGSVAKLPDTIGHYCFHIKNGEGVLRRTDAPPNAKAEPVLLRRMPTVLPSK